MQCSVPSVQFPVFSAQCCNMTENLGAHRHVVKHHVCFHQKGPDLGLITQRLIYAVKQYPSLNLHCARVCPTMSRKLRWKCEPGPVSPSRGPSPLVFIIKIYRISIIYDTRVILAPFLPHHVLQPHANAHFRHSRKEKKIDHEGCFQGALLLQSTTKEGEFKDQVERVSV